MLLHAIALQQCCQDGDKRQAIPALLARALESVNSFNLQEVANLLWELATLGVELEAGWQRRCRGGLWQLQGSSSRRMW